MAVTTEVFDVVVLGAGAAGLMCAATAGYRGRRVLVLEKSNKPGKKILMSGGGRCNFTHLHTQQNHYISANPAFCISALKRYTPQDRKSTRLNSSHVAISYAVFCLKKKIPIHDL